MGLCSEQSRKPLEDSGLVQTSGVSEAHWLPYGGRTAAVARGCGLPGDRGWPGGACGGTQEVRARCGPPGSGQASPWVGCSRRCGAPLSEPTRGPWYCPLPPGRLEGIFSGISVIGISASSRCRFRIHGEQRWLEFRNHGGQHTEHSGAAETRLKTALARGGWASGQEDEPAPGAGEMAAQRTCALCLRPVIGPFRVRAGITARLAVGGGTGALSVASGEGSGLAGAGPGCDGPSHRNFQVVVLVIAPVQHAAVDPGKSGTSV